MPRHTTIGAGEVMQLETGGPAAGADSAPTAKARVDDAFAAAGLVSWEGGVAECRRGTLLRLEFAERRPAEFVKAFSALVRAEGLKMGADAGLELYLGTPATLERLIGPLPAEAVRDVVDLGAIAEVEAGTVRQSGARRSAGVTYERRTRPKPLAGISVLVLDDDPFSREILRLALEREGCTVQTVGEAEAAFSLLRETSVDALVLDVVLGGTMDGFDFCRAVRTNAQYASIPAIFVTGYPAEHPRVKADGIAAAAWFGKPVDAARLRNAVSRLCADHRS